MSFLKMISPWWYCIIFIAAVGIVIGFYRLKWRRLIKKERELKEKIAEGKKELQEVKAELERLSVYDELTEIYNHRWFAQFFEYEWKRTVRKGGPISLIMIDIDHFKKFNQTYGREKGDACLVSIAKALQETVKRSSDVVARYGGEEFVIVLSGTDNRGVDVVAENARKSVEALNIPYGSSPTSDHVTVSLGCVTMHPRQHLDSSLLIKAAEEALFLSKKEGRNRVSHIDSNSQE
ncbi:MAG: diguanylate cyclase [Candidatus Aminicenantes bacterium]|nr:diguanylate cyclase [Candidatus Aminicenantes bacterium]